MRRTPRGGVLTEKDSGAAPASTRVRGCTQSHGQSCGACLERFFEPLTAAAAPAPDMATAKMIAHSTARPPQKHRRSDMRDARHAEAARPKPTTVNRRAPDKTLTPVSQHQGAMAGAPGRNAVVAARRGSRGHDSTLPWRARRAPRSRPALAPTSLIQQPEPMPRCARRRRKPPPSVARFLTVSSPSSRAVLGRLVQESTPHPPRMFSFAVLKLTEAEKHLLNYPRPGTALSFPY